MTSTKIARMSPICSAVSNGDIGGGGNDSTAPSGAPIPAYLSAKDLADLALPGLPRSKRHLIRVAEASAWSFVERPLMGGLTRLYATADLPDVAMIALMARFTASTPAPLRVRGRPGGSDWTSRCPDVADAVEALYIERRLSAALILDLLRADPQARYPHLPSPRTLQRFCRRLEAEQAALIASVRNPDQYRSKYRLALGRADASVTYAGEVWELDTTPADIMTTDGRMAILGVIDRWSRRVHLKLVRAESGQAVRRFLIETIEKWGVMPTTVKTDQGCGYVNEGVKSALATLGIEHHPCPPASPEKKPFIERMFGTFTRERAVLLPGFVGHNVAQAQALRAKARHETGRPVIEVSLSAAELQDILIGWADGAYNQRPHGTTRVAPLLRWQSSPVPATAAPDADVLRLALSALVGTRRVTKRGITWQRGHYWSHSLVAWMDRDVVVRRDEDDLGSLFIFAPNGIYIDTAVNHHRAGVSEEAFAVHARRKQAEHDSAARAEWRAKKRALGVDAVVDGLLRQEAEAAGKIVALPIRTVPPSSPMIDSVESATAPAPQASIIAMPFPIAAPPATPTEPTTPEQRVRDTDAVLAAAAAGEDVDPAALARARRYAATSDYRAWKALAEYSPHQDRRA